MHYGVLGMKWGRRKQKISGNGSNKSSRKALSKQRKAILKDYNNTGRINRAKYNAKLNSGTLSGTQKHYTKQTYESMTKKYGKTKVDDALKWNKRRANIGTAIGAAAGLSLALVYNKRRGRI